MSPMRSFEKTVSPGLLDVLIRAGLIAVLAIFCFRILRPFLDLMLWSVILAITLYPAHGWLKRRLGTGDGRSSILLVALVLAVLLVPIDLLGLAMAESIQDTIAFARSGRFHVPPPADAVAGWPVVGPRLHALWLQAATDLTSLAQRFTPQLKGATLVVLDRIADIGLGLVLFLAAVVVAGIVMAYGYGCRRAAVEIASRIFGPGRGEPIAVLCTATIRAVALGVVGIAFIQMLLIGVGFAIMGIPAAGLLALAVLLLGILQIPATLVTLPVIVYVFASEGANVGTIVFAVYVFLAGLVDNVLKPLLLGRGVDVPMPVVLIGALGGMVSNGVIGLFVGPVVLAVGYQLFWQWVRHPPADAELAQLPPSPDVIPP
ncbi:AI-2E family transporter [Luteimonas sp. A482]